MTPCCQILSDFGGISPNEVSNAPQAAVLLAGCGDHITHRYHWPDVWRVSSSAWFDVPRS
jgi:hypothetical protein